MATTDDGRRTVSTIKLDIESERTHLAEAVEDLRTGLGEATDVAGKLRANLPAGAAAAIGPGLVIAGGLGATGRLLRRRGREGQTDATAGRRSPGERRRR